MLLSFYSYAIQNDINIFTIKHTSLIIYISIYIHNSILKIIYMGTIFFLHYLLLMKFFGSNFRMVLPIRLKLGAERKVVRISLVNIYLLSL